MLSSVLNSVKAIEVNIKIFTKMRQMILNPHDVLLKLSQIEKQLLKLDRRTELNEKDIGDIFDVLNHLITKEERNEKPRNNIGYS